MNKQLGIIMAAALWAAGNVSAGDAWTVVGADRLDVSVLQGEAVRFTLQHNLIGPEWKASRLEKLAAVQDGARVYEEAKLGFFNHWADKKPLPGVFDLRYELRQTGPRTFQMRYTCRPELATTFGFPGRKDEKTISIGPKLPSTPYFAGGRATVTLADGKSEELPLPPPRGSKNRVAALALRTAAGEETRLAFAPPVMLHIDNDEVRCFAEGAVGAGEALVATITVTAPAPAKFEPANRMVDTTNWYPLNVAQINDVATPSYIGLEDWQEKPAGKHGFLQMKGDRFEFADGTPAKFWGVNPLKVDGSVNEEYLATSAAAMERFGVNLARFHAFGKPNRPKKWAHMLKIQDENDGLKFDARYLGLLDYGFAKMKEHGVYSGWSVIYGWYPTDADKTRVIAWDELEPLKNRGMPADGSMYGATAVMPDIQDLIIQFHVKLLNHVNPHTGKRYADDPALAYIELQNEENIFLGVRGFDQKLKDAPTYRKLFYGRFAAWLKAKYGTQETLAKAWGAALKADEKLDAGNITPFPAWCQGKPSQRIADQMHFLYTTQREYYRKFEAAVRQTGYQGAIIGSCWQAADWVGHLYNVLADRDIGFIDRHNYNRANLNQPGAGLLSAGFQSVLDRPFTFSEWAGGARVGETLDAPLVAVYGMGLQGWDASMEFAWDHPGVLPYKHAGVNDTCNDFGALAQYPALARLVRRGDVQEGKVVGNRRISLPVLQDTGDVGFEEQFSLLGGANNKSFNAAVPTAALAAGRVVLEYVDGPVAKPVVDESAPYLKNGAVRSTTGQLLWNHAGNGFFTVNTPGTKAVVGHAGGQRFDLGEVSIAPQTPFATIYVTARGAGETLATAKSVLVTALARSVDKGTVFDELSDQPLVRAPFKTGPVLVEPVTATITLKRNCRVFALDHGGRKATTEVPVRNGQFTLDGTKYRTMYYVVEFGK